MEGDKELLKPVERGVVLPVQQDAAVLFGGDGPAGELDLAALGTEQGLDGGVEGVLVGGLKRVREDGGSLALVITAPRLLRVFQITGLTKAFAAWPSVADAITADPHWQKTAETQAGSVSEWCRQHGLS